MEVAVVQDDASRSIGVCEGDFFVEDEFEGGVAGEVALHLDASVDGGVDDVARRVEENIDLLEDVDIDLVLVGFAAH